VERRKKAVRLKSLFWGIQGAALNGEVQDSREAKVPHLGDLGGRLIGQIKSCRLKHRSVSNST